MKPPSTKVINALPEDVRRYIEHLEDMVQKYSHSAEMPATLEELQQTAEEVADPGAMSDTWQCLTCHERYFFDIPVENPGSCGQCGGIGFKAIARPTQ